MENNVHDVVADRIFAPNNVVDVEREEGQLPQVERVQEVMPPSRVGDVRIGEDQVVVKMKTVVQ